MRVFNQGEDVPVGATVNPDLGYAPGCFQAGRYQLHAFDGVQGVVPADGAHDGIFSHDSSTLDASRRRSIA